MKIFNALKRSADKRDNTPSERLEYRRVGIAIEELCDEYLKNSTDILDIEALPAVLDSTLAFLESDRFLDQFEFSQVSETIFMLRKRALDLL